MSIDKSPTDIWRLLYQQEQLNSSRISPTMKDQEPQNRVE